ncbi:cell division protein FtsQ/DivIB [Garicola koreensis]|uniref:Cell division protein FtsQ n=1 Tax=Garicola koreensis TaxID=1262554 RepID=A0A7W5TPN5_9MICC|nr:FtsQ-type POTRA domain-containing protein [Garicola koreensis]MBB3667391.1 cell division protein FtsQ [Garicola koreensis]
MSSPHDSALSFPEPENITARRRRRRVLTALGAGLAVLLGLVAVLHFSPLLPVRDMEITGNELLTDARTDELLGDLYGEPMPQVGTAEVRQRLQEENVVADVEAHLELPHTLHIEITEHLPVAEVHQDQDVELYNEHGEVIRTFAGPEQLEAGDHAAVLIESEAALQDEAIFDAIVAVLGELPEQARGRLESAAAESIDSVQLELADGRTIVWGSDEDGAEKAAVLQAILASEDEAFTEAEVIDISTPTTPVTR